MPNHYSYTYKPSWRDYSEVVIVGEIENVSTDNQSSIRLTADFLDAHGQLLDTTSTYPYLSVLRSHSKTCFQVSLREPQGFSSYTFGRPRYNTSSTSLSNLTVYGDNGSRQSDGTYRILGFVRNDGAARVTSVRLVTTLFDGTGRVVGCDTDYMDYLDPDEASSFKTVVMGRDYADVTTYRVQAQ